MEHRRRPCLSNALARLGRRRIPSQPSVAGVGSRQDSVKSEMRSGGNAIRSRFVTAVIAADFGWVARGSISQEGRWEYFGDAPASGKVRIVDLENPRSDRFQVIDSR
jgi:hypothetical protein